MSASTKQLLFLDAIKGANMIIYVIHVMSASMQQKQLGILIATKKASMNGYNILVTRANMLQIKLVVS